MNVFKLAEDGVDDETARLVLADLCEQENCTDLADRLRIGGTYSRGFAKVLTGYHFGDPMRRLEMKVSDSLDKNPTLSWITEWLRMLIKYEAK